jgi:hypothetical protein
MVTARLNMLSTVAGTPGGALSPSLGIPALVFSVKAAKMTKS